MTCQNVVNTADFFSAAYSGLMAAPGMPKAVSTPSRRITNTAASIARILAIVASFKLVGIFTSGSQHEGGYY